MNKQRSRDERLSDLAEHRITGVLLGWAETTEDRLEALEGLMVDIQTALNDLDTAVSGVASRISETLTTLQSVQTQLAAVDPAAAQQLADAAAKIETEVNTLNSLDVQAAATATPTDTTTATTTDQTAPPASA